MRVQQLYVNLQTSTGGEPSTVPFPRETGTVFHRFRRSANRIYECNIERERERERERETGIVQILDSECSEHRYDLETNCCDLEHAGNLLRDKNLLRRDGIETRSNSADYIDTANKS